jgi:hypothetical protein
MNVIVKKRVTKEQLHKLGRQFDGYIKIVVDVEKGILAGGADRHFEEEKILLANGSKQADLWGGGFDIKTKETDYNSIINLRPNQENPGRDILSLEIRKKFDEVVRKLFL